MRSLIGAAQAVGLGTLRRLRRARRRVWEDLVSPHFMLRSIQTLLHVGLLDAMHRDGWVDVRSFAEKNDLDPRLVVGICEALYARGVLARKSSSEFRLDGVGKLIMDEQIARGWCELAYGYENVLFRMEDLARRKAAYGTDLTRDGLYVALGSGLASRAFYFPIVASHIRREGYRKVLDLGCGDGSFLLSLTETIPGIQGSGIDLSPEAVESGNEVIAARGLEDRFHLHSGNITRLDQFPDALDGVDAVTTFFVLHELAKRDDCAETVDFFKLFRSTLPGVPFLIVETDRPRPEVMRQRPGPAIEYFLFHDLSGQRALSRDAWHKLFERAGFTSVAENYIDFARTSIFVVK